MITIARPSGIAVPFEVPELTMEQAIDRGWVRREDGRLLEPKPEEYLLTYPVDRPWGFVTPRIPWSVEYEYPTGPFITGLPEL